MRTNIIVERAKFNRLVQGNDGMDAFIHKLYRQAEYCEYSQLREELIRDRVVVTDDKLCDKLQPEPNLNLETAISICRRHEAARLAQPLARPLATSNSGNRVDEVSQADSTRFLVTNPMASEG